MAISDTIDSMKEHISDAYGIAEEKGATIPADKNLENLSDCIASISGGGQIVSKGVDFIDYDGTILYSYTPEEAQALSVLPEGKQHEELNFVGWNYTLTDVNSLTTYATIGALYETVSGATEFDISLNAATGLYVKFFNTNGTITSVDWGDGTVNTVLEHTYSNIGDYTIKLTGLTHFTGPMFNQSVSARNYYLKRFRCSADYKMFANEDFVYCVNLESIAVNNKITRFDSGNYGMNSLKCIIYPNSITYNSKIISTANGQLSALQQISIPIGYTIESSILGLCSAQNINWVTSGRSLTISTSGWSAYKMNRITIVSTTVTTIPSSCYFTTVNINEIDFSMFTSVPTLQSENTFGTNLNRDTKIIVPDALYNSWITASRWSTYANYIYKKSEV